MKSLALRASAAAAAALPVTAGAAALAIPAWLLSAPLLTPPLGASVYVCLRNRGAPHASARSLVLSHAVAVGCGRLARLLCGATSVGLDGASASTLVAGVVALGLTAFLLDLLHCAHAPAGATTLVVALGVLGPLEAQLALIGAAALLAGILFLYDRALPRRP